MRKGPMEVGRTAHGDGTRADDGRRPSVKERVIDELKRFVLIAIYLWVLLTLFALQERIVLARENIDQQFTSLGFALINALILAKVVLIAEDVHFAQRVDDWPLIYPALYKSVAFGILCICFYVLEEMLVGLWHGKVLVQSLPPIAREGFTGVILAATILSVELIPLFATRELARVIGVRELRRLFFARRSAGT